MKTSSPDVSPNKPLNVGHLKDSRHMKTSAPPPTPMPVEDLRGVVGTPCGQVAPIVDDDDVLVVVGGGGIKTFDSSSNVTIFSRGFIMICTC